MKIDISKIDVGERGFFVNYHVIGGEQVVLVCPQYAGTTWTKDNLIFRSSIWDMDGNPVSLSYKKFFNYDESPTINPAPESLVGTSALEKIDGSTCIVSDWHNNRIIRTRGTVSAITLENGNEYFYLANEKYRKAIDRVFEKYGTDISIIFEIVTPANKIVIDYGNECDFILTNIIRHSDYSYFKQDELDSIALEFGFRRPRVYSFDSVVAMKSAIKSIRGEEGVCLYFHDDQCIRKVKTDWYLTLHRAKSNFNSIEPLIDAWLEFGRPTYQDFYEILATTYDYEVAEMCRGFISKICDASKEVDAIRHGMEAFVTKISSLPSQKEKALAIAQAYENTSRTSFVFAILNNKVWDNKVYKRLLFQCLKN